MCGSYPISAMLSSELVQANSFRQERLPHVDVLLSDRVSPQRLIGYDLPPAGRDPPAGRAVSDAACRPTTAGLLAPEYPRRGRDTRRGGWSYWPAPLLGSGVVWVVGFYLMGVLSRGVGGGGGAPGGGGVGVGGGRGECGWVWLWSLFQSVIRTRVWIGE